jgi:hypothetical protein
MSCPLKRHGRGELQATPVGLGSHDPAIGLHDPSHLAQRLPRVLQVDQDSLAVHRIEGMVGVWQVVGVGLFDSDPGGCSHATARGVHHCWRCVNAEDLASWSDCLGQTGQEHSTAAANLEDGLTRQETDRIKRTVGDFAEPWLGRHTLEIRNC